LLPTDPARCLTNIYFGFRRTTGWTRLPTRLPCLTTPMQHRLTYRASTRPLLRPMLLLPQLADTSTDTSRNQMQAGSNTPTSTVEVPGRDRSGTNIAWPIWDATTALPPRRTLRTCDRQGFISASTSRGASRPETETEDDGDGDLDMDPSQETTDNSLERPQTSPHASCCRHCLRYKVGYRCWPIPRAELGCTHHYQQRR
jgi:hypothetical protein